MNSPTGWGFRECSNRRVRIIARFAFGWSNVLPAQKTGGRYKSGFVEADPSRVFRDGSGTPVFNLIQYKAAQNVLLSGCDARKTCAGCAPSAVLLYEDAHHAVLATVVGLALHASNRGCVR
jgi:hypothetical protein